MRNTPFRPAARSTGLVGGFMTVVLLLVAIATGTGLALSSLPTASTAHALPATTNTATLLPGETRWGTDGIPAFDFGSNDGVNWDPQYNMDVPPDAQPIQAALASGGMPIIRAWFFEHSLVDNHAVTDAEQLQKLQAVQNSGAVCFANFPTDNSVSYDLHLLDLLNGACPYVEVMNEPELAGVTVAQYLSFWNSFIPQARAAHPGILFGGPATYDDQGNECTYNADGSYACSLKKTMQGMKDSGNLPDFVTYHWYPCWNDTADSCLARASSFAPTAQGVIDMANSVFGPGMPVVLSEWNADPGNPAYMNDRNWDSQFVVAALQNIETSGLAGAMEYDISQYGNYGADDLFDIYNGGAPFATWNGFAGEIARVRQGTPPPPPPPPPAAPTISSFSPSSGAVGDSVVLTGTAFTGATSVAFNGTAATSFTVNSDTQVTATVPSGATTGPLSITTPGGSATSSTSFTVNAPPPPPPPPAAPSITGFSPTHGLVGDSVVITGAALTGASRVTFNGTAATSFTVNSDTQITATVPSGATSGPLGVTTPGGSATSSSSFTVDTPPPPPPPPSGLALVQAKSANITNAISNPVRAAFVNPVAANHLLVAQIDLAGGFSYSVGSVTDSLGNTWTKAAAGVNGDETDVELWYTNSVAAGADTITATKAGSGSFLQAKVTVSEWNSAATFHAAQTAGSTGTSHSSGAVASTAGDLVVGGYADAGYLKTLAPSDGKTVLGTKVDNTDNIESIEAYGTADGSSAATVFSSSGNSYGQVTAASFTPAVAPAALITPTSTQSVTNIHQWENPNPGTAGSFERFTMTFVPKYAGRFTLMWRVYAPNGARALTVMLRDTSCATGGVTCRKDVGLVLPKSLPKNSYAVAVGIWNADMSVRYAYTGILGRLQVNPAPAPTGTSQSVWETFYAARDNDPAGSRDIAYPGSAPRHSQAGGTGTYADPLTLASDKRWLPVGTRVYAPRWHKYYIMEDECVECEADWANKHFHHVDLYMSSSVQAGVIACENDATKDEAENDTLILNPASNLPVDITPLYTDSGGCVYQAHQYPG